MIMGRTPDGAWWQVCCMANQPVWVSGRFGGSERASRRNPTDDARTHTCPATTTSGTAPHCHARRPRPCRRSTSPRGPEFPIKRDDGTMTLLVQVYEGPLDNQHPLGGYQLKVFRDGVDVDPECRVIRRS